MTDEIKDAEDAEIARQLSRVKRFIAIGFFNATSSPSRYRDRRVELAEKYAKEAARCIVSLARERGLIK